VSRGKGLKKGTRCESVGTDGQDGQKMMVIRVHWFIIIVPHGRTFLRKTFGSWSDLFSPTVPLPKACRYGEQQGTVSAVSTFPPRYAPDPGVLKK
jgi:hypothetical protein